MSSLERYRRGEHEQVWAELVALGPAVRREPHLSQAREGAVETMRRVRRNCEVLVSRLRAAGYTFGVYADGSRGYSSEGPLVPPTAGSRDGQQIQFEPLGGLIGGLEPCSERAFPMATIHHQVAIDAPAARVYAAISTAEGIGTWWDKQTASQTPQGLVLEHNPGPEHGAVKLRVVELVPDRRVEWECISTHPATSPASAWTGTRFVFDLADRASPAARLMCPGPGPATTVDFRQVGYDERSEFAGFNNFAWGQVLQNLKMVVEGQERG